jgi:hypothetical protein
MYTNIGSMVEGGLLVHIGHVNYSALSVVGDLLSEFELLD